MTGLLTAPMTGTLRLVEPMPGFDDDRDFTIEDIDPDGLLLALRSVRDPGLRFVLTPAPTFFGDYRPQFGDAVTAALGAAAGTPLRVLLVLTIGSDLADATANLRAPIVMVEDGAGGCATAMQVVLDDDTLSMREPILPVAVPE